MIFGGLIDLILVVLIFSLGIKFNEKYPNAAHKFAFVLNAAEAIAKWLYKLSGLGNSAQPPAAK